MERRGTRLLPLLEWTTSLAMSAVFTMVQYLDMRTAAGVVHYRAVLLQGLCMPWLAQATIGSR